MANGRSFMIFTILFFCASIKGQKPVTSRTPEDLCSEAQQDCRSCLGADPSCTWCSDPGLLQNCNSKRCRTNSENKNVCNALHIQNPQSSFNITVDRSFNTSHSETQDRPVQLKPQKVAISLRPGYPQKINLTFRRVTDNPLDLYYVMDLSYSMGDDLSNLQKLGTGLPEAIRNFSNNAWLGFGSFVDKVILPFGELKSLGDPCDGVSNERCSPAFGFRHQLPINDDPNRFSDVVSRTAISGNVDSPEGGFDALMQIASCSEDIAWREDALKVVLFATDASPHIAMDGKLANIYEKNDENCHLQSGIHVYYPNDTVYTLSKQMDYPSVGQLKKALKKNNIQIIFAVTEEVLSLYESLVSVIGENAVVEKLASDSSNIVEVISTSYNIIRYRMILNLPEKHPADITIAYRVLCPGKNWKTNTLFCDQVLDGEDAIAEFEFEAQSCSDTGTNKIVTVSSTNAFDRTVFTIDHSCQCPCENEAEANSLLCNSKGIYKCGLCTCDSGFSGTQCKCEMTSTDIWQSCRQHNRSLDDPLCSGHGCCECGNCTCEVNYFGEFCQCSSLGCPEIDGKICGARQTERKKDDILYKPRRSWLFMVKPF